MHLVSGAGAAVLVAIHEDVHPVPSDETGVGRRELGGMRPGLVVADGGHGLPDVGCGEDGASGKRLGFFLAEDEDAWLGAGGGDARHGGRRRGRLGLAHTT